MVTEKSLKPLYTNAGSKTNRQPMKAWGRSAHPPVRYSCLPTQSKKHNRKQKPKERGRSPTQTTTKQPPRHQEKKPLMPAQNQSNQPNSKPSHYTTGQITKDSKEINSTRLNTILSESPQECLSMSSQYIIIAIIIARRAPSNQQLASHNVVRVVKSNLAAPHKGGQPHHGVQNAKAGFGSGRCSGHLRRQGPQGKQKGGIVCGLGGDSRCKFYAYPTRRLL